MSEVTTIQTYDTPNSIREDLSNIIYNISPETTPFMSNIGRDTADNTYFEWQTDVLAAADTGNAVVEGADAGDTDFTPTVRVANYTQISNKVVSVTGTSEAVNMAGMRSLMAYETAKKAKELKRDMEAILLSNQAGVAGNTSTARKTAGFPTWLITNSVTNGATLPEMSGSGGNGYPDTAWTGLSTSTDVAFTETMLKTAIQNVWTEGGEAKVLMVGPYNKTVASAFAGLAEQRVELLFHLGRRLLTALDRHLRVAPQALHLLEQGHGLGVLIECITRPLDGLVFGRLAKETAEFGRAFVEHGQGVVSRRATRKRSRPVRSGRMWTSLHRPWVAARPLATSARPIVGTTFSFNTSNIVSGTVLGATMLSFVQINPGIDLGFLAAGSGNFRAAFGIVALVVLIKAAFYWLNAQAYRSMAKMKAINPRVMELRERMKDNPQQMQMEMMKLYREEKVNPMGGCLPIAIQIPVFIALYWVLLSTVEMRDAPWLGWVKDLASPDPYFILPVLMTLSTLLQTWLNPTPPDPMQAKLMWIMPLAFSVMFFFFPSGLVLYWLTNNILSIAQQWMINKQLGVLK